MTTPDRDDKTLAGEYVLGLLEGAAKLEAELRLSSDAVFARDYPLVQGVVLLIAVGFILTNLMVDVLYGLIDPRIRAR